MTLSPTGAAILAAFGASAITGAVTFGITIYSTGKQRDRDDAQRAHERERDRIERQNKLEDEQRERLRTRYQAVVFAGEHDARGGQATRARVGTGRLLSTG